VPKAQEWKFRVCDEVVPGEGVSPFQWEGSWPSPENFSNFPIFITKLCVFVHSGVVLQILMPVELRASTAHFV